MIFTLVSELQEKLDNMVEGIVEAEEDEKRRVIEEQEELERVRFF